MRPGRGKAKGSAFEREVCRKLSLWVTHGEKDDCFWRSAISGGRATVAKRKGKIVRQDGDICAVAPEGHVLTNFWFIECKHVKKLDLEQFLVKGDGLLATFWRKALSQCGQKIPVIIAKQNRWPTLVIAPKGQLEIGISRLPSIKTQRISIWYFESILKCKFGGFR